MEIFDLKTMQRCEINTPTVVALGMFDGCHMGHIAVFQGAISEARKIGAKAVAYTFDSLPKSHEKRIQTNEEKIKSIRQAGLDYIAIDSFDEVKNMSGEEFFSSVLIGKLHAKGASCGFNYHFGKGAKYSADDLKEYFEKIGGSVVCCEKIPFKNDTLSSSLIKKHIENGSLEELYGYLPQYSFISRVEMGKRLGRELGFPTINQKIPTEKMREINDKLKVDDLVLLVPYEEKFIITSKVVSI